VIWIGVGVAAFIVLFWISIRAALPLGTPPRTSGQGGGQEPSRVPRDPRPLVRTGAAEESIPDSDNNDSESH